MKTLKIKKENFVKWYFDTGYDDEKESILISFGRDVKDSLMSGESYHLVTIQGLFDGCNHDCINVNYLEGFPTDDYREIEELGYEYELFLI